MRDFPLALTYDDVLLVPKRSTVLSRKNVSLKTRLTKRIELSIPIIPANMDTVCESAMAIAFARHGSIGFIHRFLTVEQQVNEIQKVKRSESVFIENPLTILPHQSLNEVKQIIESHNIHNLLVVDSQKKLLGIVTHRDLLFEDDLNQPVSNVMTTDLVTGKKGILVQEAAELLKKNKVEKLPVVDAHGKLAGLFTSRDILNLRHQNETSKDKKGRLLVGAAVGVKSDCLERTQKLLEAGCDVIVVDVAHGHSDLAINTVKKIKKSFPDCELVAGNVATAEGTQELIVAGADCVKVGVGPGASCVTRIVTGAGVPQLTAVMECAKIASEHQIPVIADGGIKNSGDIVKALVAGAQTVLIGSLFAGTDESPGISLLKNGKKFKVYRGMASFGAQTGRKERETGNWGEIENVVAEGVESLVPYKGPVSDVISQLVGGVRSGFSYCGAANLAELRKNAEFVRMTGAGLRESGVHDISAHE